MAHEMWLRSPAVIRDMEPSYWAGSHLKRQVSRGEKDSSENSKKSTMMRDTAIDCRPTSMSLNEWGKLVLGKERW